MLTGRLVRSRLRQDDRGALTMSYVAVLPFIFLFGTFYIYRMIRTGPARRPFEIPHLAVPNRPMSLADEELVREPSHADAGE